MEADKMHEIHYVEYKIGKDELTKRLGINGDVESIIVTSSWAWIKVKKAEVEVHEDGKRVQVSCDRT